MNMLHEQWNTARVGTQSSDELLSYFASGELDAVRPMDDGQAGRGGDEGVLGSEIAALRHTKTVT